MNTLTFDTDERGQTTVAMAMVLVLVALFAWGIAQVGAVMIERAQARTLADAVALAEADVVGSGTEIASSFGSHHFSVTTEPGSAYVQGTDAQAQAFATASIEPPVVAPAVVAIVARAEQLTATTLVPMSMKDTTVTFGPTAADVFATVAAELGMCTSSAAPAGLATQAFDLC